MHVHVWLVLQYHITDKQTAKISTSGTAIIRWLLQTMLYDIIASSELLANVAMLRDMLHFRDNPSLCSDLFDTGEIDAAIRCICTE